MSQPRKFTVAQKRVLAEIAMKAEQLNEKSKDYWRDIKIPWGCVVSAYFRAGTKADLKACRVLEAEGYLAELHNQLFVRTFKPLPESK